MWRESEWLITQGPLIGHVCLCWSPYSHKKVVDRDKTSTCSTLTHSTRTGLTRTSEEEPIPLSRSYPTRKMRLLYFLRWESSLPRSCFGTFPQVQATYKRCSQWCIGSPFGGLSEQYGWYHACIYGTRASPIVDKMVVHFRESYRHARQFQHL